MNLTNDGLRGFRAFGRQGEAIVCQAPVVIIRGGNRAGLTTTAAVKVALAARPLVECETDGGMSIADHEDRPKRIAVVGVGPEGADHEVISLVLYPKLFGGPAPLITENEIQAVTWRSMNDKIPHSVRLRNGTEIVFMTRFPKNSGENFDLVWLDNLLRDEQEIEEILLHSRRFVWSTWPFANFKPLRALSETANRSARIREFVFRFGDNPHINVDLKVSTIEHWKAFGPDHELVRNQGEFPDADAAPTE